MSSRRRHHTSDRRVSRFLHASLQLDAISRCTSEQDVSDTLATFPSDIKDVYHQTWTRIVSQTPSNVLLAEAVLLWVSNAARSMTIEELRHAVATHPETHKFERKRLASASTLMSLCCGLVIVGEKTKLVRFIRGYLVVIVGIFSDILSTDYTAKETLHERLCESFLHPNSLLASVCITHLAGCGFRDTKIDLEDEYKVALQTDPLLAYTSESWVTHARRSLGNHSETDLKIAHFVEECKAFPSFTVPGYSTEFDILTSLHVYALCTLQAPRTLAELSKAGGVNAATSKTKKTPLMLASWCGNTAMVKVLAGLEETQMNLTDIDRWSALMFAADGGHEDTAKLLLSHPEIQVNIVDDNGWSALTEATRYGHQGIGKALLARPDVQVNMVSNEGWSALIVAASEGHQGIVEVLLARLDIQVNMVNNRGWSALIFAASNGHQGIVEVLLARPEIQVNIADNKGWSALMVAASAGHQGIVKALLARPEIQVNSVNNEQGPALIFAASNGHQGIVEALLVRPEIQVNMVDDEGWSALMDAAQDGHQGIVEALLARPETQVNMLSDEGESALMLAASEGHQAIVKVLLARPEIQVNMVNNEGWSALMAAAGYGHQGAVQALLMSPEIQVDLVSADGESALSRAIIRGDEGIAKALRAHIEAQTQVTIPTRKSSLPIQVTSAHSHLTDADQLPPPTHFAFDPVTVLEMGDAVGEVVVEASHATKARKTVALELGPESSARATNEPSPLLASNLGLSAPIATILPVPDLAHDSRQPTPERCEDWIPSRAQPVGWGPSRCTANSIGLSGTLKGLGQWTPMPRSPTPITVPAQSTMNSDVD